MKATIRSHITKFKTIAVLALLIAVTSTALVGCATSNSSSDSLSAREFSAVRRHNAIQIRDEGTHAMGRASN